MSGYLIACIAALLFAAVNIIDKILVERYCKDGGVGALVVLSALFPVVLIPVAYFFAGNIWLSHADIAILIFSGMLAVAWIYLYLEALYEEDVSVVMPLFQLTPVFALLFGIVILGELPHYLQLLAGLVILLGSLVLSVDYTKRIIKRKLVLYITGASAIIALMNALFKFVALDGNYWTAIMWHSLGIVITGVCVYAFHRTFRSQFHDFIKQNWGIGISLNAVNETLTIVGDSLFAFAILLAPLALVQSIEAYQPVFVFIAGVLFTKFAPQLLTEDTSKQAIIQKVVGITLVILGSIMLAYL
jgi:drug/metabolite transporter (DMT)-like permease